MGAKSQRKSRAAELELCRILQDYGYPVEAGRPQSYGEVPDLSGLPGVHIEVKRVERLNVLEAMAQAEAIRAELKADLESKGEEEHNTGSFVIHWKEIISSRLDGKALKAALPDVFAAYSRECTSRRFTIA